MKIADDSLAICSAETGSVVASASKAIVWKPDAGAGMGGVCRVTAEHAHTRSKFRTAKGDHVFTIEISITLCCGTGTNGSYRICDATMSRWFGFAWVRIYWIR